ncbi:hypothetical protein K458DRAFT_396572 [Lentithecium fluviatile CBS 122367]|uniref:Uncharacterized protein n=1 Tax=Lentithecium fluviatile CBS 122367 TaxID=1168545 RepID=A0A6G1IFI0_9PLEO|nr:hypothetical protein K458DRAFT_396572 [Lentithecium fluviatile CBS 122367]
MNIFQRECSSVKRPLTSVPSDFAKYLTTTTNSIQKTILPTSTTLATATASDRPMASQSIWPSAPSAPDLSPTQSAPSTQSPSQGSRTSLTNGDRSPEPTTERNMPHQAPETDGEKA